MSTNVCSNLRSAWTSAGTCSASAALCVPRTSTPMKLLCATPLLSSTINNNIMEPRQSKASLSRLHNIIVNYLQTRACGARKGSFVAYFAGYARKIRNKRTKKAREVGLAQRKTNYSQALGSIIAHLDTLFIGCIVLNCLCFICTPRGQSFDLTGTLIREKRKSAYQVHAIQRKNQVPPCELGICPWWMLRFSIQSSRFSFDD